MGKLPKLLCLSFFLCTALGAAANTSLHITGRYFIYSDKVKMVFGCGDIVVRDETLRLRGEVLYYDVSSRRGVLYGGHASGPEESGSDSADIVYFQGVPPRFHYESLGERVESRGTGAQRFQLRKPTLEEFRDNAVYFEFRGFNVDSRGRVRAETVIPYIMGMPSMPMRRFTVNRGSLKDRTLFYIQDLNYTRAEGLGLDTRLQLHLHPLRGNFSIIAYERELFRLPGIRRGLLYSGQLALHPKKSELLNLAIRGNTGERSFNLTLSRSSRIGPLEYKISQQFSDRSGSDLFSEIRAQVILHPFKGFQPQFSFRYNWQRSVAYQIATPLELGKKIRLNLGMERRILREGFESDQMELRADFDFQSRWFSLDSGFRINQDMLAKVNRKNFSLQIPFKPISLLGKNIFLTFTPFYLFNSFPSGEESQSSSSPGIRFQARSRGLLLPLGLTLRPSFTLNHIWDGLQEDMTDFRTELALVRRVGGLELAMEYGLASRFRSQGFWVEGTHTRNLSVTGEFRNRNGANLRLRMIMDNDLKPETMTWNGQIRLPWNLRLSSFVIYYIRGDRFQTVEVFIEKVFKHKLKIQGGYSLALRKFFIKLLLV